MGTDLYRFSCPCGEQNAVVMSERQALDNLAATCSKCGRGLCEDTATLLDRDDEPDEPEPAETMWLVKLLEVRDGGWVSGVRLVLPAESRQEAISKAAEVTTRWKFGPPVEWLVVDECREVECLTRMDQEATHE